MIDLWWKGNKITTVIEQCHFEPETQQTITWLTLGRLWGLFIFTKPWFLTVETCLALKF